MHVAAISISPPVSGGQLPDPVRSGARPTDAAAEAAERKKVGAQFEAILVRQLLGPTLSSMVGREGGAASDVYGDLLADTLAQQLTAGPGLGLGRLLEQQLAPRDARPGTAVSSS